MSEAVRPTIHHVALTVRDVEASIPWYENLFGIKRTMEEPHQGGTGIVLTDEAWQLIIVLHRHDANAGERFAETRTGLDHVGFVLPDRAALEAWQARLQELGVVYSPIVDRPYGSVLVFRDPDNIQLELFAPPGG